MPLVPPYIESLRPYEAGRATEEVRLEYGLKHVSKLASNENPLGPSPLALEAMPGLATLNLYPNGGLDLRRVLADKFDVKIENVIAGSGSEGIMSNIIRTFLCDEDEVLTTEAAFIGFQVLAKSRGVKYRTVPYRDWHYDLAALAAQINEHTKIIYLANPNNPTGTIFTKHEFDEFYRHVPERVLIILDEAYFEYAKDNPRYPGFDALPLRQRHHAAHVFEDLRPGGRSHRLWIRARGSDRQSAQGKASVRAEHAGAGGGHRARSRTRSFCTGRWS